MPGPPRSDAPLRPRRGPRAQELERIHRGPGDVRTFVRVGVGDGSKRVDEGGRARYGVPGEVGAAEYRRAVRREPDGERPAAAPDGRRDVVLVDGVDIGPKLAVDLDRDVPVVQDRPVEFPGERESLLPPGEPVHRVFGVLAQVGADG